MPLSSSLPHAAETQVDPALCLEDEIFAKILGGALQGKELAAAEKHLDACPGCGDLLASVLVSSFQGGANAGIERVDAESMPVFSEGQALGRYTIQSRVGSGAMGVVYAAHDPQLDRRVAIKLLRASESEDSALEKLREEGRAMAKVKHPNVVRVFEIDRFENAVYVAMEFVDGKPVPTWIAEDKPSKGEITEVFVQIAHGLSAAHRAGIVHGDIKPANILVQQEADARPKAFLTDFGLAQSAHGDASTADENAEKHSLVPVASSVAGTPAYLAPELLLLGKTPDRDQAVVDRKKADQFAFGVSLYECLQGARPFAGHSVAQLRESIGQGLAKLPSIPRGQQRALSRGLSLHPEDRWPDMESLATALQPKSNTLRNGLALGVLSGGAAMLALFIALPSQTDEAPGAMCSRGPERTARVWNDTVRQSMAGAFENSGHPLSRERFGVVAKAQDRYADSWAHEFQESCEATWVHEEQSQPVFDARMQCLDRRLQQFQATTELLANADKEIVEHAVRAVAGISSPLDCQSHERVDAELLPTHPLTREAVTAMQSELHRAHALGSAGRYAEAQGIVENAIERYPLAIEHRPMEAEAYYLLGDALRRQENYRDAQAHLRRAAWAGQSAAHDWFTARSSLLLITVSRRLDDAKMAEHWTEFANAAIERMGDSNPKLRGDWHVSRGNLLWHQAKYEEAKGEYQEALKAYQDAGSAINVALAYYNLGMLESTLGHGEEAVSLHNKALALRKEHLGPNHPEVADSVSALGNAFARLEDYPAAEQHYREAIRITDATSKNPSPPRAAFLGNLGAVLGEQGRYQEAREVLAESLEVTKELLGEKHSDTAYSLVNLGDLAILTEDYTAAETYFSDALQIWESTMTKEHPLLGYPLTGLAEALHKQGKSREALAFAQRAFDVRKEVEGPDNDLARSAFVLAQVQWSVGERAKVGTLLTMAESRAADKESVREISEWKSKHQH